MTLKEFANILENEKDAFVHENFTQDPETGVWEGGEDQTEYLHWQEEIIERINNIPSEDAKIPKKYDLQSYHAGWEDGVETAQNILVKLKKELMELKAELIPNEWVEKCQKIETQFRAMQTQIMRLSNERDSFRAVLEGAGYENIYALTEKSISFCRAVGEKYRKLINEK